MVTTSREEAESEKRDASEAENKEDHFNCKIDIKTRQVHEWMKSLSNNDKMQFALNWRIPHSLFNVACKLYPGDGDKLQTVNWYEIYKSRDMGNFSHGGKVYVV